MIQKLKSKQGLRGESGFTIIEVLIVLAIAGLIMLIVFLAVPALNRNSHNNQYRNEASQLLAATSEFINNNNGNMPVAANNATILSNTKNKNLTSLTIEAQGGTTTPAAGTYNLAVIRTGAKCNGATTAAGSPRGLAVLYNVETGSGGSQTVCTES